MKKFLVAMIAVTFYYTPSLAADDARPMSNAERWAHTTPVRTASLHKAVKTKKSPTRQVAPDPVAPVAPTTSLIAEARKYIGSGPVFGRAKLWCGRFTSYVLQKAGYKPGSDLAANYARYGRRVPGPQVGAIAVMTRGKGGGHVGIVTAVLPNGDIRVISGNHNNRVAESVYPAGRAYAYVVPTT